MIITSQPPAAGTITIASQQSPLCQGVCDGVIERGEQGERERGMDGLVERQMKCDDRRMEAGKKVMNRVAYLVSFCNQAITWSSIRRVPSVLAAFGHSCVLDSSYFTVYLRVQVAWQSSTTAQQASHVNTQKPL